jgi:hypothetical protein
VQDVVTKLEPDLFLTVTGFFVASPLEADVLKPMF